MRFLGNQDLNNFQLQNYVVDQGTSFPGSYEQGQLFFRTDLDKLYIRLVSSWQDLMAGEVTNANIRVDCWVNMYNPGTIGDINNQTKVKVTSGGVQIDNDWLYNTTELTIDTTLSGNWIAGTVPSAPVFVYVYARKSGSTSNFEALLSPLEPNLYKYFRSFSGTKCRCIGTFVIENEDPYDTPSYYAISVSDWSTPPTYTRIFPFLRQGNFVYYVGPSAKRSMNMSWINNLVGAQPADFSVRAIPKCSSIITVSLDGDVHSNSTAYLCAAPKNTIMNFTTRAESYNNGNKYLWQDGAAGNHANDSRPILYVAEDGVMSFQNEAPPGTSAGYECVPAIMNYWEDL